MGNISIWNFAVLSGLFAATGGICEKISGSDTLEGLILLRLAFIALMICFNTCGYTFFVKSLHHTNSTLITTILSATLNYIFSGIASVVIFKERISTLWSLGICIVLAGLSLLTQDQTHLKRKVK